MALHSGRTGLPAGFGKLLRILVLVCCAAFAGAPTGAFAQSPPESTTAKLDGWEAESAEITQRLDADPPSMATIATMRTMLDRQLAEIPAIRAEAQSRLTPLRDQLAALGPPPEDPATELAQLAEERARLTTAIAELEARDRRAVQAVARANGLLDRLNTLRRDLFTAELLSRGPHVFEPGMLATAVDSLLYSARIVVLETGYRVAALDFDTATVLRLLLPAVLILGAMLLLVRIRNLAVDNLLSSITEASPQSRRVAAGAGVTLARLLLPAGAVALLLAGASLSGLLGGMGQLMIGGFAKGAGIVIGAYALGGAFFAPSAPLLRLSRLEEREARKAHRWLILLAGVVGLDRALVQQGSEVGLAVEALTLLNGCLLIFGGIALWKFANRLRPIPRAVPEEPTETDADTTTPPPRQSSDIWFTLARLICRVVAVLAPLAALGGYYAASRFAFYPLVFSGAVIGLCILLFYIVRTVVDQLVASEPAGVAALDRLQLIPVLVGFLLICGAVPVLALIWGADVGDLATAWRQIIDGFNIGEVRIAPVDFLYFLMVISIGVILTRRFTGMLKRSVLPLTGLDTGGRDAIGAAAGYAGILVSTLIAISATGVDLSNLALVAGALSVGIGFGLQNIVNNFVSGIILLIERPIKAGDWIEISSGTGYVRNINVRSTEVETFDRSTLFVPNSQLISEKVINWTHTNLNGRLIVPVGVAFDSNPRQVERILMEIARAHPLMLRRPAPQVLFRSFGPDALNFEIRGILRDVNWIFNVLSDINFEIARRFAEEGISIPVRQADIGIRNIDQIGSALGAALGTPQPEPQAPRMPVSNLARPSAAPPPRPSTPASDDGADSAGPGDAR